MSGDNTGLTAINTLLQTSIFPGKSLGIPVADDIITGLEWNRYDAKQVEAIRNEVNEAPERWSLEAFEKLQAFFGIVHSSPKIGRQLFWGRGWKKDKPISIPAPSLADIINGSVGQDQFKQALNHIHQKRFNRKLHDMASQVEMPELDLAQMLHGMSVPKTYGEVIELANKLSIEPEAFTHSWIADRFNESILWQITGREGWNNRAASRFLNLAHAANLIQMEGGLLSLEDLVKTIAGTMIDMPQIAAYADIALRAGFEPQLIYEVIGDYIQSLDKSEGNETISNVLIDNFFEDFNEQYGDGYPRLAAISSRLASLYWQRHGEKGLAAVAEYNGALGMIGASWLGRDSENTQELSNPKRWEHPTMRQARDFLDRSAALTVAYEREHKMTMGGAIVEDIPWRRAFIDAILVGDTKGALHLSKDGEISEGVRLSDKKLQRSWLAIPEIDKLWELDMKDAPVVTIRGKGYYMPPQGTQPDVYFDAKRGRYERIPQSGVKSDGGNKNGGSSTPPVGSTSGNTPPAAPSNDGGVQASSSFIGFVDSMQLYLDGLTVDPKIAVDEFAKSYPSIWSIVDKDDRFDLINQALNTGKVNGGGVSPILFTAALHRLCQLEGYISQGTESVDGSDAILTGATHTFGGIEVPIGLSSTIVTSPVVRPITK